MSALDVLHIIKKLDLCNVVALSDAIFIGRRGAARCMRTQRLPESHSMSIELLDAALIAVPDGFVYFGMRKLTAR